MSRDLIKKLKETKLYNEILKDNVVKGEVFLAFRDNRIDFYYEGGKLFSYDNKGFSTHIKYASVIVSNDGSSKDYVTQEDLENYKVELNFLKGIKRIKENCQNYAGEEAKGVAEIYSQYSYLKSEENIVVLDIEYPFEAEERDGYDRKVRDRVDILLLDIKNKKLFFVEAKHFPNEELLSTTTPDVINQIKKYEQHIKNEKTIILKKYQENVELLNELFQIKLPQPKDIDENVILFVFGFDKDQRDGRLTALILNKKEYKGKKVCLVGNAKEVTPEKLISTEALK